MLRELFYSQILKQLKDCKTFIDVGAGNSIYKYIYGKRKIHFYEFLKDKNIEVDAIDINSENDKVIKMDFKDIHKKYDVFFSSHFIEHINNPLEYMKIAKRYCRKYIVTVTDRDNKEFWDEPTHIRPHSVLSIKTLYLWFDFEPIKVYNVHKTFCVIGERK